MDGDNKFYFWDSTADQEESGWMNNYEETKRQKLIFDNILSDYNFKDKRVFDPGCGLGFFPLYVKIREPMYLLWMWERI